MAVWGKDKRTCDSWLRHYRQGQKMIKLDDTATRDGMVGSGGFGKLSLL
jgi:hypothetical protein